MKHVNMSSFLKYNSSTNKFEGDRGRYAPVFIPCWEVRPNLIYTVLDETVASAEEADALVKKHREDHGWSPDIDTTGTLPEGSFKIMGKENLLIVSSNEADNRCLLFADEKVSFNRDSYLGIDEKMTTGHLLKELVISKYKITGVAILSPGETLVFRTDKHIITYTWDGNDVKRSICESRVKPLL